MLNQWILPIFETDERQSICGQCFIVGSNLVTAAHIIEESYRPYVLLAERKLPLTKDDTIAYSYTPQIEKIGDYEDYAIFHLPYNVPSLFQFAEIEKGGYSLSCHYYRKENKNNLTTDKNVFTFIQKQQTLNSSINFITSAAIVDTIISPKVFQCNVSPLLTKGDSGSPIITSDNTVLGFLLGACENNLNMCVFQSAAFIKTLINHE